MLIAEYSKQFLNIWVIWIISIAFFDAETSYLKLVVWIDTQVINAWKKGLKSKYDIMSIW